MPKHKRTGLDVKFDLDGKQVESVKVNLKAEVWLDLLDPEGQYLPYCCANVSRIRDILVDVARNGRYADGDQLFEIYTLIKSHNHGQLNAALAHLVDLWDQIKGDIDRDSLRVSPINPATPEGAVHILSDALPLVNWNLHFTKSTDDDRRVAVRSLLNLELLKIIPAIHTLYNKVQQLDPGPIDGYAVCNENEICSTAAGYAIFFSEQLADDFVRAIGKHSVRPVTVSLKDGVVFNDVITKNNSVDCFVKQKIRGGYLCKPIGREGEAFMPFSHAALKYLQDEDELVGKTIKCIVLGQEPGRDLRVSRKLVEEKENEILKTTLQVGDVYEGTVRGVETYGVFVDTGIFRGLIHRSRMEGFVPSDFRIGEEVQVKVTDISDLDRIAIKLKEKA